MNIDSFLVDVQWRQAPLHYVAVGGEFDKMAQEITHIAHRLTVGIAGLRQQHYEMTATNERAFIGDPGDLDEERSQTASSLEPYTRSEMQELHDMGLDRIAKP